MIALWKNYEVGRKGTFIGMILLAISMALTTTVTSLADSLFLANYPVTSLPAYLMGLHLLGVTVSALLFFFARQQNRPLQIFFLHCFFGLIAFNAIIWSGKISWLNQGVLCLIVHASATVINVAIWAQTMGYVHTARAKSQVPLLAAGLTVGGSISGLVLVLVGQFVLVKTALFFAIFLLLIYAPTIFLFDKAMSRPKSARYTKTEDSTTVKNALPKKAIDDPLVQFLAIISFIFAIGSAFLDFQYKSILQSQPNAERIAFYLGGLHLVLNILVLTGQLTLSKLMVDQIRVHRIFAFYPRFVILAVLSALFMPALLGAFFARITERTFRYLVLNASTDIFMGPMRDQFKTRAVWLTKGIAGPLGTLVSLSIIMVLFQFIEPGELIQIHFLYVLTFLAFAGSLLFASKLEEKYQAFLGQSLGVGWLAERTDRKNKVHLELRPKPSPSYNGVQKGQEIGLVELEFLNIVMPLAQRKKALFRLEGHLDEPGAKIFLSYLATEKDTSALLMALRFLLTQNRPFAMPVPLVEHEHPLLRFIARALLTNVRPAKPFQIDPDFNKFIYDLELIREHELPVDRLLDHLRQEKDVFNRIEQILEQLMLGTPWHKESNTTLYPKWRHMVSIYHLVKKHPLGILCTKIFSQDAQMVFTKKTLLSLDAHQKIWACYQLAFMFTHRQIIEFAFFWSQHLKGEDVHYLLPILEHPDPFLRSRVMGLLYLSKLRFNEIRFDDANLAQAIQRTTLDCMIGTGIRAERQQKLLHQEATFQHNVVEEGFERLLDAQLNELITLFFGMYGLIVGPMWAKQLYQRFTHGSHLTKADVVEYCRTQAESKLIEPMMMVLGTIHPDKTIQVLRQNLPKVEGSFITYAKSHSRLTWFQEWMHLAQEDKKPISICINAIMMVPQFKNLPPYLVYQMAVLSRPLTTEPEKIETKGKNAVSLLITDIGDVGFISPDGGFILPKRREQTARIWLAKDMETLMDRDTRLKMAFSLLQYRVLVK